MKIKLAVVMAVAFLTAAMLFDYNGRAFNFREPEFLNLKFGKQHEAEYGGQEQSYSDAESLQAFDSPESALRFYFDALKAASNMYRGVPHYRLSRGFDPCQ